MLGTRPRNAPEAVLCFVCVFAVLATAFPAGARADDGDTTVYGARLANHFWFLVPPLLWNIAFTRSLGTDEYFTGRAPTGLVVAENLARVATFAMPAAMPIRTQNTLFTEGAVLYGVGLASYFGTWAAMVLWPDRPVSSSPAMRLAPAYLPILWLGGMAVMSGSWAYFGVAAVFVAAHVAEYVVRLP